VTLGGQTDATAAANALRYAKPLGEEAALVERAAADERAVVMLDFARFPVFRVAGDCLSQAIVQIADLRYTEPSRVGRGGGFAAAEIPVACPPTNVETGNR
jgi:hypothetical protein